MARPKGLMKGCPERSQGGRWTRGGKERTAGAAWGVRLKILVGGLRPTGFMQTYPEETVPKKGRNTVGKRAAGRAEEG